MRLRPPSARILVALGTTLALGIVSAARMEPAQAAPVMKAGSLSETGGEMLDVSAEELSLDVNEGKALLTGKVSLTRGDLRLSCPRLEVRYDDGPRVTWAKGTGGVRAELRGIRAEAPSVEIDLSRNLLELQGGVRIERGAGFLRAERATVDIASSRISLHEVKGSLPIAAMKP